MIKGKLVIAVIPARGGSKGIPGKNLYRLGQDTLLERAIKIAKLCKYIDRVIVSTDDVQMFSIARAHGVSMKALRPEYLASDGAKTIDVIIDAFQKEKINEGWVLLLQVTTPLRTLDDLNKFCQEFSDSPSPIDSAVSLVPFDNPHPNKIQKIENGLVKSYLGTESMLARQSLPKVYALNGAFYIASIDTINSKKTFFTNNMLPFIMPVEKSVNLDTPEDIYLLEAMVAKGKYKIEEY